MTDQQSSPTLTLALALIERGWAPTPVTFKGKDPTNKGWQHTVITKETAPQYFNGADLNIGILLGKPSGGLVDIDLDCAEAIALAPYFLPTTGSTFGRKSKPRSHHLYIASGAHYRKWQIGGENGCTIVEARSTGQQTVVPGSTHASGETIEWAEDGQPAEVHRDVLTRQVGKLAAAALLLRNFSKGIRHDCAIAMAGALIRSKWLPKEAYEFVDAVMIAAGCTDDVRKEVAKQVQKLDPDSRRVPGRPRLRELLGEQVEEKLAEWLSLSKQQEFSPKTMTAHDLLAKPMVDPKWAIQDIVPEGVTLVVAKPKMAKTLTAMNMALSVASGGKAMGTKDTTRTGVLFLALEDNERRLQRRLKAMLGDQPVPDNLYFFCEEWPRGDVASLRYWLDDHPEVGFVIIDTLGAFRALTSNRGTLYEQDYTALQGLQRLAGEKAISILVLYHSRKMPSDDPLDLVSGSTGLTGAADEVLVIVREDNVTARLCGRGRSIEMLDEALSWDSQIGCWRVEGSADVLDLSATQREILKLIRECPRTTTELMDIRQCKRPSIMEVLDKLYSTGYVSKESVPGSREIRWVEAMF